MNEESRWPQIGLWCLGLVIGALIGGGIGVYSKYAVAEWLSTSTETQAYLTLLIIPSVVIIGAVTVGFTLAAIPKRSRWMMGAASLPGWGMLLLILVSGFVFNYTFQPAEFRVENRLESNIMNLWLGGDFRRSQRLGDIRSGGTTEFVDADLKRRGAFNAITGKVGERNLVHYLPRDTQLAPGRYTYVVTERDSEFHVDLNRVD